MGHCLVVEALGQMMSNKVENEFFHSRGKVPRTTIKARTLKPIK